MRVTPSDLERVPSNIRISGNNAMNPENIALIRVVLFLTEKLPLINTQRKTATVK